jgi:hypothetical protein
MADAKTTIPYCNCQQAKQPTFDRWAEALAVQDACNLRGVSKSFVAVVEAAVNDPECQGTDWIRNDPAVRLFADKINDMVGRPGFDDYCKLADACRDRSAKLQERR